MRELPSDGTHEVCALSDAARSNQTGAQNFNQSIRGILCVPLCLWSRELFEQLHRVHRTFWCFFMLEVGKNVASSIQVFANPSDHRLPFLQRVTRLTIAIISKVSRGHIRRNSLFGLGHTQRPVVF